MILIYLMLLISCESKTNVNKNQTEELKTESNNIPKEKIITQNVKKESGSLTAINGTWKVKSKFLRQMSAVGVEDLEYYSKDSIVIDSSRVRFFKNNICDYNNIIIGEANIDDEILKNFQLTNSNNKELIFKCKKYNEYLFLTHKDLLIYELDGAVFLLYRER